MKAACGMIITLNGQLMACELSGAKLSRTVVMKSSLMSFCISLSIQYIGLRSAFAGYRCAQFRGHVRLDRHVSH